MRIRSISIILIFLMVACVGRLTYLQLLRGDEYAQSADRQYVRPVSSEFSRGTIYMTEKTGELVSAATLRDSYYIVADPSLVVDAVTTFDLLNKVIALSKTDFMSRVSRPNDRYEVLVRDVSEEVAERIKTLKLKGITIYVEKKRYYPGGTLASHVLGYVAHTADSGDEVIGQGGLEKYYNDILTRETGGLYVNFFAEIFSNLGSVFKQGATHDLDGNIILTIEPTVERELSETIRVAREKWQSDQIGGVIIEPTTGRIIAMAASPDFNPDETGRVKNANVFRNPIIEDMYEMGSTMKPLVMAAALDTNSLSAETTYTDNLGHIVLNNKTISNYDGKGRGTVNMQEVLNQSLNTGMVFVSQKMGKENLAKYLRGYGFGKETRIELPNETPGMIDNLNSTREVEFATAAFGQGIAVTPIQMAAALSTLGNGGKTVAPHIVERIEYRVGIEDKTKFSEGTQLLKPETSEEITRMLVTVVDKALVNGKAKMEHYTIAAKTGTAQMANLAGKGYYSDRYLHSFFGYFPAYNPRFLIFLFHTYPKGAEYASATLTDPFMDLTKFLINYYNIPPDR